jgi:nitrogen fixation protein NifB
MDGTWKDHPCFTAEARHTSARVHLPVAPRCNVQCRFCDRKFDCTNESRPGVTSRVLSPEEALDYLARIRSKLPSLAVVGIAGPGDPFANPVETMETLRLVRRAHPDLRLCVATNGLQLPEHVAELADLKVSHVTVTVNAVDAAIGSLVYAFVRDGKRSLKGEEGAALLLERQLEGISRLKARGMTVKINTLILPDINTAHIPVVAARMKALGVDIMNCMPLQLNDQATARGWREPTSTEVALAKGLAGQLLPQMNHCNHCRADAAGLLDQDQGTELIAAWTAGELDDAEVAEGACCSSGGGCGSKTVAEPLAEAVAEPLAEAVAATVAEPGVESTGMDARPYIAVASREGFLVSAHLGEARSLRIYSFGESGPEFLEERAAPPPGGGMSRWASLAATLKDCRALAVNGVGTSPRTTLEGTGLKVHVLEGLISEALYTLFDGREPGHLEKRRPFKCGESCEGAGNGCGA